MVALPDQSPQRRLRDVEPQRTLREGQALVDERRQDLLLQVRPEGHLEVLVVLKGLAVEPK